MTQSSSSYFGADSPQAVERERLSLLETLTDEVTQRRLEGLGLKEGFRCLEVAAGHGSIARWLSQKVGAKGHVVATDLDTHFVEPGPNLEVRKHDVLRDDVEAGAYDLVHCRALLMHLPDPKLALTRLARAVKPGGFLCVEELDWASLAAVDKSAPWASEFDRVSQAGFDFVRVARVSDSYFGRKVKGLVETLGLERTGGDGVVEIGKGGGHPAGRFQTLALGLPVIPLLIGKGVMTKEEHEKLLALYADPDFEFVGFTCFAAWGYKPCA